MATSSASRIRTVTRNAVYVPLWQDRKRFNVLVGGSGSGKSVTIAQRKVDRFLSEKGHNELIVRKVARTNRFSTFALMKSILNDFGVLDKINVRDTDMTITAPNGNCMIFEGLDDIEKVKSITFPNGPLTDIWFEEASEGTIDDFRLLNLRLRGQSPWPFQFTLSMNPINVDHWVKSEFFDTPKPNATTLRTTYLDNRFIDEEYKYELEQLKITDPIRYQVYALGEWGQVGDQAFPNAIFAPCPYRMEDFDDVSIGMDFGFQHYHAIEYFGIKDGVVYTFREQYVRHHTNPQLMNIAAPLFKNGQRIIADSAEPKSIEEWKHGGFNVHGVDKSRKDFVKSGFNFLRERKWVIDPEQCPGLAAEVRGAVFRKDKGGRATEDIFSYHDDALAASRYAIERFMAPKETGAMGTLNLW